MKYTMKVTFPHMGNMYIPIKVLLETMGIDYAMPPLCNKKTLEYGVVHSPEFACLPFKTILGDFIQGIENGADYILFGGGCGQCRLGYYGDLQAEILKSLNYKVKFVNLDLSNMNFKNVVEKLKPFTEGKSVFSIVKGTIYAIKTVFAVDRLNNLANYTRCREVSRGETDKLMKLFHKKVQKSKGYRGIHSVLKETRNALKKVKVDKDAKPLRVKMVGEIYTLIEPFVNLDIEKKLGNMGVEVCNEISISHWIKEHFIKNLFPFKREDKSHKAGREFMNTDDIGGHGLETIGSCVLSWKHGYDGVIQVYPFTCMPEIIAQSTFSTLQEKYPIPIMTLVVDEMTGQGGYMTRIEAFVDMLKKSKEAKEGSRIKKQFVPQTHASK